MKKTTSNISKVGLGFTVDVLSVALIIALAYITTLAQTEYLALTLVVLTNTTVTVIFVSNIMAVLISAKMLINKVSKIDNYKESEEFKNDIIQIGMSATLSICIAIIIMPEIIRSVLLNETLIATLVSMTVLTLIICPVMIYMRSNKISKTTY